MKTTLTKEQPPKQYVPKTLTVTFETEEEYDVFYKMAGFEQSIPKMIGQMSEGWITSVTKENQLTLTLMLQQLRTLMEEMKMEEMK